LSTDRRGERTWQIRSKPGKRQQKIATCIGFGEYTGKEEGGEKFKPKPVFGKEKKELRKSGREEGADGIIAERGRNGVIVEVWEVIRKIGLLE